MKPFKCLRISDTLYSMSRDIRRYIINRRDKLLYQADLEAPNSESILRRLLCRVSCVAAYA